MGIPTQQWRGGDPKIPRAACEKKKITKRKRGVFVWDQLFFWVGVGVGWGYSYREPMRFMREHFIFVIESLISLIVVVSPLFHLFSGV